MTVRQYRPDDPASWRMTVRLPRHCRVTRVSPGVVLSVNGNGVEVGFTVGPGDVVVAECVAPVAMPLPMWATFEEL